jgi:hypothetical protein
MEAQSRHQKRPQRTPNAAGDIPLFLKHLRAGYELVMEHLNVPPGTKADNPAL